MRKKIELLVLLLALAGIYTVSRNLEKYVQSDQVKSEQERKMDLVVIDSGHGGSEVMGDPRERNYQSLFSELAGYEKKGVYMLMNGVPASPMQIVQAHIVREDAVYMRDYVLNDNGDIKELCFDDVEMQEQDR